MQFTFVCCLQACTHTYTPRYTQNVVVSPKSQPHYLLRQEHLEYSNVRARRELRDDLRWHFPLSIPEYTPELVPGNCVKNADVQAPLHPTKLKLPGVGLGVCILKQLSQLFSCMTECLLIKVQQIWIYAGAAETPGRWFLPMSGPLVRGRPRDLDLNPGPLSLGAHSLSALDHPVSPWLTFCTAETNITL